MNVPASSTLLLSAPGALFQGFFFSRLPAPGAQTQIPASPTMSLSSLNLTVARDPGRSLRGGLYMIGRVAIRFASPGSGPDPGRPLAGECHDPAAAHAAGQCA